MPYGALKVGRLPLAEPGSVDESVGDLSIEGQESSPPSTRAAVYGAHGDLVGFGLGGVVPVTFPDKPERDGFYEVTKASSRLDDGYGVIRADWKLDLTRFGSSRTVDLEAQLVPAARANDAGQTGTHWHALPVGATAYDSGATMPLTVSRTTEDGVVTVLYSVPTTVSPRWQSTPAGYRLGRARVLDNGREVTGERGIDPTTFELGNGLVRVRPLAGAGTAASLELATWSAGAYKPKQWALYADSDQLGPWSGAAILRNDFEAVSLRLIGTRASNGTRVTLDLSLRRGSRFLDVYATTGVAAFWSADLWTTETASAGTGYRTATADDADGLRFLVGSTKNFAAAGHGGLTSSAASQTFAAWLATTFGAGVAPGDGPADIRSQYIGAPAEEVRAVRR